MKVFDILFFVCLSFSLVVAQGSGTASSPSAKKTTDKSSEFSPTDKELRAKILNEEIIPLLEKNTSVAWTELKKQIAAQHGATIARQVISRAKPIFFRKKKDWKNVRKSLSQYIDRYGTDDLDFYVLNVYAWDLFENTADKKLLKEAAKWSLKSIELQKDQPELYDTYANLLYRMGKTKEAIKWQEKAVELAKSFEPLRKQLQATLDKMKKGEPTWPVK